MTKWEYRVVHQEAQYEGGRWSVVVSIQDGTGTTSAVPGATRIVEVIARMGIEGWEAFSTDAMAGETWSQRSCWLRRIIGDA